MSVRKDYAVANFSWISMLHYWEAKKNYEQLSCLKYICGEAVELGMTFINSSIITVTFSAMALEAFFNDYAAKKLGDKLFYENFEILRPMGKLQLIAKFILNTDVIKGTTLCNLVDTLFRERNNYVHSKSKDGHDLGMTEDEYKEFLAFAETDEGKEFLSQPSEIDMKTLKAMLQSAFDALCALREVGKFFDEHDSEKTALARLLSAGGYVAASPDEITHVQEVQKELGIPVIS
jgi:hypothetical protein